MAALGGADIRKETPAGRDGKVQEPDIFQDGKELAGFLKQEFEMTAEEAETLLSCMDGQGFCLGHRDGGLYRGDLCCGQGKIQWEPDSIDDAASDVMEWNYILLQAAESELMHAEDGTVYSERKKYLEALREDEKILDAVFERTKHGKELDTLAAALAEALIQGIEKDGMDAAVKKVAGQIREAGEQPPEHACTLKQTAGRKR